VESNFLLILARDKYRRRFLLMHVWPCVSVSKIWGSMLSASGYREHTVTIDTIIDAHAKLDSK